MPIPPPVSNTFNGGSDTTVITAANSGGASGDAFNVVSGSEWTFTNVQSHSGGMAARVVNPSNNALHLDWNSLGSYTTDVWTRSYHYLPSLPGDNNFYPISFRTSADAATGIIRILSTGIIQMRDFTNTQIGGDGSVAVATAQWFRLEVRIRSNGASSQFEWRLYNSADSTSITDTQSATGTLGANTDRVYFGITTAQPASFTAYMDDLMASSTDWIGPAIDTVFGKSVQSLSWLSG